MTYSSCRLKLITIKTNHIECIQKQVDVFTFYLKYLDLVTVQTIFTKEDLFAGYRVESKNVGSLMLICGQYFYLLYKRVLIIK
jgi:hypothetical protein